MRWKTKPIFSDTNSLRRSEQICRVRMCHQTNRRGIPVDDRDSSRDRDQSMKNNNGKNDERANRDNPISTAPDRTNETRNPTLKSTRRDSLRKKTNSSHFDLIDSNGCSEKNQRIDRKDESIFLKVEENDVGQFEINRLCVLVPREDPSRERWTRESTNKESLLDLIESIVDHEPNQSKANKEDHRRPSRREIGHSQLREFRSMRTDRED